MSPEHRPTVTRALADTVLSVGASPQGASAPLPDVGDIVGGSYRLVRRLGQGMFGRVYVAQRLDVPEHQVALKIMRREMYSGRNVERELVMLAAASHPHVVQLKDHGMTDEYVWLTMPVYEGQTLGERLQRGTLGLREAYDIFLPVARAVEALHRSGMRHQDLKPENIFLADFAGQVHPVILDLGVAAEKGAAFVAGTILYAAPEQVAALTIGASPLLSEKMDTYGLAATLLMALVGPELFPGYRAHDSDELAKAHEVRATRPLSVRALPELQGQPRKLLEQCLCRWFTLDPAERPTMAQLAQQLDVLLEHEREREREQQRRQARQQALLQRTRMAVVALLLIGLGLITYAYSQRKTLRLARELAQARADEAASFDKLETCDASHKLTQRKLTLCTSQARSDRLEYNRALEDLRRTGSAAQAEWAGLLQQQSNKLKACEDDAERERTAWQKQRDKMREDFAAKETLLTQERDELRTATTAMQAELLVMRDQFDACDRKLGSCLQEVEQKREVESAEAPEPEPASATPASAGSTSLPVQSAADDNPYL